jgi:hypothetical protein
LKISYEISYVIFFFSGRFYLAFVAGNWIQNLKGENRNCNKYSTFSSYWNSKSYNKSVRIFQTWTF